MVYEKKVIEKLEGQEQFMSGKNLKKKPSILGVLL